MADKIKKLSEAIRLGATFRPEKKTIWFDGRCGCAVLAAAEATGFDLEKNPDPMSAHLFPHLIERFPDLTEEKLRETSSRHATGMSREQVADWLEAQGL